MTEYEINLGMDKYGTVFWYIAGGNETLTLLDMMNSWWKWDPNTVRHDD